MDHDLPPSQPVKVLCSPSGSPRLLPHELPVLQHDFGLGAEFDAIRAYHDSNMPIADFFEQTSDSEHEASMEQPLRLPKRTSLTRNISRQKKPPPPPPERRDSYLETGSDFSDVQPYSRPATAPHAYASEVPTLEPPSSETQYASNQQSHTTMEHSGDDSMARKKQRMRTRRQNHVKIPSEGIPSYYTTPQVAAAVTTDNPVQVHAPRRSRADNILDIHAITLQALLRDTGGDEIPPLPDAGQAFDVRASLPLDAEGRAFDPLVAPLRPGNRDLSNSRHRSASVPVNKRPIGRPPPTPLMPQKSPFRNPPEIVRTPYPIQFHKPFVDRTTPTTSGDEKSGSLPRAWTGHEPDYILTLSLRRKHPDRGPPRVARLVIPASSDVRHPQVGNGGGLQQHFALLDFDDALFFKKLRKEYARLVGPYRWISARTLSRISAGHYTPSGAGWVIPSSRNGAHPTFHGQATSGAEHHAGTMPVRPPSRHHHHHHHHHHSNHHHPPRHHHPALHSALTPPHAPDSLNTGTSIEPFSESNLLAHFRSPKKGKARYGWVHWARRLASARHPGGSLPSSSGKGSSDESPTRLGGLRRRSSSSSSGDEGEGRPTSNEDMVASQGNGVPTAGLEFVATWNVARIIIAMLCSVVVAIAAGALWMWLAPGQSGQVVGNINAARLGPALGLAAFVLVLCWTCVAGWLWVSWAVM